MARIVKVKNTTGSDVVVLGQTIVSGTYFTVGASSLHQWSTSDDVFVKVASGDLVVNNGTNDLDDPLNGWDWVVGEKLPLSDLDGKKLAVHTSYKPALDGIQTYAVWTGCGDDIAASPDGIGDGDLLHFDAVVDTASQIKEVKFDPVAGRVWIHEAYLKFEGGGEGDYISAEVIAEASVLQTSVNLDLVLTGDDVSYAPGGAGTGTHGFAGTPVLVPRTFAKDGDWDYDGATLTPNMGGTGGFKIRQVESIVHKYINKIACYGSCQTYFSMSSDETAEVPAGYFIRVKATNGSNTAWHASVIMEIYRERTV
jgi:hypothetical protein